MQADMTELTTLRIERTETIALREEVYTLHFCKSNDAETYELIAVSDATKKGVSSFILLRDS
jgi:hypothetical protein